MLRLPAFRDSLQPDADITPQKLEAGKQALVRDAAWANLAGSLGGGVVLAGFAVAIDASPALIGALAAVPFFAAAAQLPAMLAVERLRRRKIISVGSLTVSRLAFLALAAAPFIAEASTRITVVFVAQIFIALMGAVAACSFNSWVHQLLGGERLGELFSRRLFWSTVVAAAGAMAAGAVVDHWPFANPVHAYAVAFAGAALAGLLSSRELARVPEPPMAPDGPSPPVRAMLQAPFADRNFRRVIRFVASWNFASNIAAPFTAVYLIKQEGFSFGTVTTLWVTSQAANALTMYTWGKLSDRHSNKAVLLMALPCYFAGLLALPLATAASPPVLALALLYLIHIVFGVASGGIALAGGNIGLKLAPARHATAYLAAVSLVGSVSGGIAAMSAGLLADWFSARALVLNLSWTSPVRATDVNFLQLTHWEFLFVLAFLFGLYALHVLSAVEEGERVSQRAVIRQFVMETLNTVNALSSIEGSRGSLVFPIGRLRPPRRGAQEGGRQRSGVRGPPMTAPGAAVADSG